MIGFWALLVAIVCGWIIHGQRMHQTEKTHREQYDSLVKELSRQHRTNLQRTAALADLHDARKRLEQRAANAEALLKARDERLRLVEDQVRTLSSRLPSGAIGGGA